VPPLDQADHGSATTCPYCGVGCGLRAAADGTLSGDAGHPANAGRLCVKGSALGETLGPAGRLGAPQLRQPDGGFADTDWDSALTTVADGFSRIIAEHGPEAVAFYVSGQLLTEDYFVANKLMKGYIGSANIDTNSRLCMSSAVAGHKRAFGEDVVPGCYADFEQADTVILVGSNLAWCHPVLYQRLVAAKQERSDMRVIVVDPRRHATCEIADLHLPIKPGSDVTLFNGLLGWLAEQDKLDRDYIDAHTAGLEAALTTARAAGDIARVAQDCGLRAEDVAAFFEAFAASPRVVTAFSQGVNQSSAGTDKVNAIINSHLAVGAVGKPGAGPFSITGQPNAMGGREVGGLANQLAAHLDIEETAHRELLQAFWGCSQMPEQPGLKAVDLFEAVHEGRVRAIWIMATNPVVSLPEAERVRAALAGCELVVVSDIMAETETARLAHVRLPAAGWGERDGTVTNSERCISRQRPFLPSHGEARPDWWIISQVAARMGFGAAFDYAGPEAIFDEHARLSGYGQAAVPRVFDISGLAGLSRADYDALEPCQWPLPAGADAEFDSARCFGDGCFATSDGRAHFVACTPRPPAVRPDVEFRLVLNTGRVRDQWHTMTRTGLSPKLAAHRQEVTVDLHATDALASGVQPGGLARVKSPRGEVFARVSCSGEMQRGHAFLPIHWNGQTAARAEVGKLIAPVVDPISGEPEFKHTPVAVSPLPVRWHGYALLRNDDADSAHNWLARWGEILPAYWCLIRGEQHLQFRLAGFEKPQEVASRVRALLGAGGDADWLEYSDQTAGDYRAVWLVDDRLEACFYLSARPDLPGTEWLSECFASERLAGNERAALLAGAPSTRANEGPTVCACFGVGRQTIVDAIRDQDLDNEAAVTKRLRAGGNCGSCLPEIRALLADVAA
jgi:assimilatory nitrate reductase catalytic subunit